MSAPKPKGNPGKEEYVQTAVLNRFEKIESLLNSTQQRVKIWQDTISLIVIVIFVATLAVAFTVIFFFAQAINSDAASRNDLTRSV